MIRSYTLPPDQSARALEAGGPLADLQVGPERLRDMQIAVVEVDGRIVAYWVGWMALHVEPLWIHDAYRKSPGVAGGLVGAMQTIVEASGEPAAFCVLEAENVEQLEAQASRLGFVEAPGKLYYLVLHPAGDLAEG